MILEVNKKLSGKKEKQTSLQKKHWCSRKTTEAGRKALVTLSIGARMAAKEAFVGKEEKLRFLGKRVLFYK